MDSNNSKASDNFTEEIALENLIIGRTDIKNITDGDISYIDSELTSLLNNGIIVPAITKKDQLVSWAFQHNITQMLQPEASLKI